MNKPFSKKLYDADDDAKYQVIKWLKRNKYEARVNPNPYGVDLLANKDGKNYCFEVEVKHNWDLPTFPFSHVHFSARKKKFIHPDTYFTMLNHQRNKILLANYEALSAAPTVTKSTVYTSNEEFIEVDVNDCAIYSIRK